MVTLVTSILGIAISGTIIFLMRRDRLFAHHGLFWMCMAGLFALLGLAPGFFDFIARFVGVAYPPVLALSMALGTVVVKLMMMDMENSRLAMRNERLIQQSSILQLELEKLKRIVEELQDSGNDS